MSNPSILYSWITVAGTGHTVNTTYTASSGNLLKESLHKGQLIIQRLCPQECSFTRRERQDQKEIVEQEYIIILVQVLR